MLNWNVGILVLRGVELEHIVKSVLNPISPLILPPALFGGPFYAP